MTGDCKMTALASGLAAGLGVGMVVAHLWTPSWCEPRPKKTKKQPEKIKLTYFNIQGVAERVRLALVYYGIPFEDDRINFKDWGAMKSTTPYGQLPLMYLDGSDKPIAQSNAMLNYVAGLGDGSLYPDCTEARLVIDEVLGLAGDFDRAWMPAFYMGMIPQKFGFPEGWNKTEEGKAKVEAMRTEFVNKGLKDFLGYYSKHLKKHGNKFLCGSKPTIADFYVLPQLSRFSSGDLDHVPADCLNSHPEIVAWIERVQSIPSIKAWYTKA